ncbi:MAG TPA: methyltransferase domain-containing protein [Amycolatopsis sp.]
MSTAAHSYGQGHAESVVRSQQWRTVDNSAAYLRAELRPGLRVLDVGCGPGTITADLARLVAPSQVTGLDVAEDILDQAREHAAGVGTIEFRLGDVNALEFPDGSFDVVHAHQVLLHLRDPVGALREMLRVAKTGGVVAVRDTDYLGAFWFPADPRLDRWRTVYRAVSHANGAEPDAGRRLLSWAHAAGATDVTPSASIWSHSTPEERAWWGGMWAERILHSRIAEQAVDGGHATPEDLQEISSGWQDWARHPDGFFAIPHGEVLCRK